MEEQTKAAKDNLQEQANDLADHATDFLDTFYKLTLVNVTQRGVNIASATINAVLVFLLVMFVLFFGGIGLCFWIGSLINSTAGGFFIVAGFFLLVMLVVLMVRKKTIFPYLRNLLVKKIYD